MTHLLSWSIPTADITSRSQCSFSLSLKMTTESFYKHYSGQSLLVSGSRHSMLCLLATSATPPDEDLHHNGYSEIIVNSACYVMNATLRRLFGNFQKWNASEMWWFRGCSPTATYKERGDTMWRAWGSLPPSQLWSHHLQSLDAAVMVCCFHGGGRGETTLHFCQQGGLKPHLLSKELGFILRQHVLTG